MSSAEDSPPAHPVDNTGALRATVSLLASLARLAAMVTAAVVLMKNGLDDDQVLKVVAVLGQVPL